LGRKGGTEDKQPRSRTKKGPALSPPQQNGGKPLAYSVARVSGELESEKSKLRLLRAKRNIDRLQGRQSNANRRAGEQQPMRQG